jgi:hypothetical protein
LTSNQFVLAMKCWHCMNGKDNHLFAVELSEEQNGNMLDGILNNLPPSPLPKGP